MSRHVPETLRKLVFDRAGGCCEYCKLPQAYSLFAFQTDHIRSLKHGGLTVAENLALACAFCNTNKGPDLGTALSEGRELTPFFHPRLDRWADHFELDGAVILPKTAIGEATARVFLFNEIERVMERQILIDGGLFPV